MPDPVPAVSVATNKRRPSFLQSFIPLCSVALFIGVAIYQYRIDPANRQLKIEVPLIAAAIVAGLIAYRLGYSYKEIQMGIIGSITKGLPAMLIVITVAALCACQGTTRPPQDRSI